MDETDAFPAPIDPTYGRTPRRARRDGWTRVAQVVFLHAIARGDTVTEAAAAADMSVMSAYRLRRDPRGRAFALAWSHAVASNRRQLLGEARRRAIEGMEEPVFSRGEQIGTRTRHSDRLLEFLIRRADREIAALPVADLGDGGDVDGLGGVIDGEMVFELALGAVADGLTAIPAIDPNAPLLAAAEQPRLTAE